MTQETASTQAWLPPDWLLAVHEPWLAPIDLRSALVRSGMTDRAIRRQVRAGVLGQPRRGSYCAASDLASLDDRGRHAVTGRSVLMQSSTEMSLSHSSSLPWYDAPEWGLDFSSVHVTRHDGRAGRREGGVCQHKGKLLPGDVVTMHGLSLTSPCRAGLELTMIADLETSLVQVNHLLHAGFTTIEDLWARYEAMEEWPRTLHTPVVLRLARREIESVLESRFWCMCYRHSLPMPEPQHVIKDAGGRMVARLDFAWPELGKYAECDGRVKYEKLLKPGERASDVVLREKERDKLVRRLTGMEGERFTWSDIEHEARTVARLRAFLFDT